MPEIKSQFVECYVFAKTDAGIQFLLLKRSNENKIHPGIWQIVTGRIEENEKAYKTAFRELKEETGLTAKRLFVLPNVTSFYTFQNDSINIIPLFLAEVEFKKAVISEEHSEYRWLEFHEAVEKLHWDSQKENLRKIIIALINKNPEIIFTEIVLEQI